MRARDSPFCRDADAAQVTSSNISLSGDAICTLANHARLSTLGASKWAAP
jgi:hypothetical protein